MYFRNWSPCKIVSRYKLPAENKLKSQYLGIQFKNYPYCNYMLYLLSLQLHIICILLDFLIFILYIICYIYYHYNHVCMHAYARDTFRIHLIALCVMCVYMCVCMHVCKCVWESVHVCVHECTCVRERAYICVCRNRRST